MPFTFAHPSAVLPIHSRWRNWLSLPPLVIGSLLPDAAYYVPLPDHYKEIAHTWWGALYLSLPLGLLLLLIVRWIAPQLAFLLPSPHREALERPAEPPAAGRPVAPARSSVRGVLFAAVGIALGAETHVLWDSFTHETGWAVERFSWLRVPLWHGRAPVYFELQVLSTLAGLWILAYVYDRWMSAQGFDVWTLPPLDWRVALWLAIAAGCAVAAVAQSHTIGALEHFHYRRTWHFGLLLITGFIGDFLGAAFVAALAVKLFRPGAGLRSSPKPQPAQTDPA